MRKNRYSLKIIGALCPVLILLIFSCVQPEQISKKKESPSIGCIEGNCLSLNGAGTYLWLNGNKYVGEWKGGKRSGQGGYYWADEGVNQSRWSKRFQVSTLVFLTPDT